MGSTCVTTPNSSAIDPAIGPQRGSQITPTSNVTAVSVQARRIVSPSMSSGPGAFSRCPQWAVVNTYPSTDVFRTWPFRLIAVIV